LEKEKVQQVGTRQVSVGITERKRRLKGKGGYHSTGQGKVLQVGEQHYAAGFLVAEG